MAENQRYMRNNFRGGDQVFQKPTPEAVKPVPSGANERKPLMPYRPELESCLLYLVSIGLIITTKTLRFFLLLTLLAT